MGSHLRLTALVAATAACLAYWCARPAPDWALARTLLRECRRAEALERGDQQALRLNQAKGAVTAETVAGRLTLAEAACRFREAEETVDDGDAFLWPYRRATGERGLSRNVLLWAAARVGQGPGSAAALARLEGEYRQRYGAPPRPLRQEPPPLCRPASGG